MNSNHTTAKKPGILLFLLFHGPWIEYYFRSTIYCTHADIALNVNLDLTSYTCTF